MNTFQQMRFQHTKTGAIPHITIHLKRGEDIRRPPANSLGLNHIRPYDHRIEWPEFVQDAERAICAKRVVREDAVSFVAFISYNLTNQESFSG